MSKITERIVEAFTKGLALMNGYDALIIIGIIIVGLFVIRLIIFIVAYIIMRIKISIE